MFHLEETSNHWAIIQHTIPQVVTSNQSLKYEWDIVITSLITCLMVQSLKFKVAGSKTMVDIVVILKSSHFELKCKQMK